MAREFLLVDGYNIIFAWPELKELSMDSLEGARMRLADILCNYQGYRKNEIILVFDGHKSKGNIGSVIHYHNIDIVFTREAQTADQFIEAVSYQMARTFKIRVATSDYLEQIIILGKGAIRMSARELYREVERANRHIKETCERQTSGKKNLLFDQVSSEMAELLEKMRLDQKD